jgi:membrane fusion protein (multidrug efflux system)
VSKVFVHDNQRIKCGDLLVELDAKDFKARLDAVKAALEAAKAANKSFNINAELTSITTTGDLDAARAGIDSAKASVQSSQADADAAKSKTDQAIAQLEYARSALAQAIAELDIATVKHRLDETDLKRYKEIAGTISKQQLDHAVVTEQVSAAALLAAARKADTQKAMVTHAEAVLKTSEDELQKALAEVKISKAELNRDTARLFSAMAAPKRVEQSLSQAKVSAADMDKAAADVELAALEMSYTKIYAPISGYITKKFVEPGMYVQTGQALMSIVEPDVWVTANFKETQLTYMHSGQPASISVDAYPDVEFNGHVDSIQRGTGAKFSLLPPENATGNYVKVVQRVPVKIVFDNLKDTDKYVLAPGMSVVPEVNIKAK